MNAEIDVLRLEQAALRRHWLRFGFISNAIGVMLCAVVLIKVAITGDDPPAPMIFIVLTYIFLGIAFVTAGRSFDVMDRTSLDRN
jgi:hypothetical protein